MRSGSSRSWRPSGAGRRSARGPEDPEPGSRPLSSGCWPVVALNRTSITVETAGSLNKISRRLGWMVVERGAVKDCGSGGVTSTWVLFGEVRASSFS